MTKVEYRKKIIEILQVYEDDEEITIREVVDQIMAIEITELELIYN